MLYNVHYYCNYCSYFLFGIQQPQSVRETTVQPLYDQHHGQGYRFLTHALVHGDWMHLLVNMFVLLVIRSGS